jgi:hypothetical protein
MSTKYVTDNHGSVMIEVKHLYLPVCRLTKSRQHNACHSQNKIKDFDLASGSSTGQEILTTLQRIKLWNFINTVEPGYNVMKGTEYFVSL